MHSIVGEAMLQQGHVPMLEGGGSGSTNCDSAQAGCSNLEVEAAAGAAACAAPAAAAAVPAALVDAAASSAAGSQAGQASGIFCDPSIKVEQHSH